LGCFYIFQKNWPRLTIAQKAKIRPIWSPWQQISILECKKEPFKMFEYIRVLFSIFALLHAKSKSVFQSRKSCCQQDVGSTRSNHLFSFPR
jgi:hypothetical protein